MRGMIQLVAYGSTSCCSSVLTAVPALFAALSDEENVNFLARWKVVVEQLIALHRYSSRIWLNAAGQAVRRREGRTAETWQPKSARS